MMLAFYRVDNSIGYDRQSFDLIYDKPDEILEKLDMLNDDEWRLYDMSYCEDKGIYNALDFQENYNDEILDGGWWCIIIND